MSLASGPEDWRERGHLFSVADGMGAHAAGELASRLAIDQIAYLYRKHREQSPTDAILSAVRSANEEIHRRGQANLSFHNMGTTCSSLLLLPQGAVVAHVGDSRVYRFRRGTLHQLTFDHSLVWEMQQATKAAHATDLPGIPKNVITRSIGPHAQVSIDLEGPFPLEQGDCFLLCSDGLTGRVEDVEIADALAHLRPESAAKFLLDLAILRGGKDNITLIVARVMSPELVTRGAYCASVDDYGRRAPQSAGRDLVVDRFGRLHSAGRDHVCDGPIPVGLGGTRGLVDSVGGDRDSKDGATPPRRPAVWCREQFGRGAVHDDVVGILGPIPGPSAVDRGRGSASRRRTAVAPHGRRGGRRGRPGRVEADRPIGRPLSPARPHEPALRDEIPELTNGRVFVPWTTCDR